MTLATINHVRTICRLTFSYVSALPDITQKIDIDEMKQRLIDTWDRIPQGIIDEAIDQ